MDTYEIIKAHIYPCVICVGANFYGASVGRHAGVTDPLTYGQINAGGVRLNLTDFDFAPELYYY